MDKPQTYIYKELAGNEWLPLVGLFPLIIGVASLLNELLQHRPHQSQIVWQCRTNDR